MAATMDWARLGGELADVPTLAPPPPLPGVGAGVDVGVGVGVGGAAAHTDRTGTFENPGGRPTVEMIDEIPLYWAWETHWPFTQSVNPLRAVAGSRVPLAMAPIAACCQPEKDEKVGSVELDPEPGVGMVVPPDSGVVMVAVCWRDFMNR